MEFEKLQNIIAKILDIDVDDISMNMKLIDDLGVDSLDLFQIIMELEEEFDIEISNKNNLLKTRRQTCLQWN